MPTYAEVAAQERPAKQEIVSSLASINDSWSNMAYYRGMLKDKMIDLYAPYKKGDKVLITTRKKGRHVPVQVYRVFFDPFTGLFSYMFRYKGKGKQRFYPSGHVVDITPY